jgi:hypothetical protein
VLGGDGIPVGAPWEVTRPGGVDATLKKIPVFCRLRRQEAHRGKNADSSEIESIRVPADADGGIA